MVVLDKDVVLMDLDSEGKYKAFVRKDSGVITNIFDETGNIVNLFSIPLIAEFFNIYHIDCIECVSIKDNYVLILATSMINRNIIIPIKLDRDFKGLSLDNDYLYIPEKYRIDDEIIAIMNFCIVKDFVEKNGEVEKNTISKIQDCLNRNGLLDVDAIRILEDGNIYVTGRASYDGICYKTVVLDSEFNFVKVLDSISKNEQLVNIGNSYKARVVDGVIKQAFATDNSEVKLSELDFVKCAIDKYGITNFRLVLLDEGIIKLEDLSKKMNSRTISLFFDVNCNLFDVQAVESEKDNNRVIETIDKKIDKNPFYNYSLANIVDMGSIISSDDVELTLEGGYVWFLNWALNQYLTKKYEMLAFGCNNIESTYEFVGNLIDYIHKECTSILSVGYFPQLYKMASLLNDGDDVSYEVFCALDYIINSYKNSMIPFATPIGNQKYYFSDSMKRKLDELLVSHKMADSSVIRKEIKQQGDWYIPHRSI